MNMRILSAITTVTLLVTGTSAYSGFGTSASASAENFHYVTSPDGTGINILAYGGTDPEMVIPDIIDGLPVKLINTNAFKNNIEITSAKIPDTVIAISGGAFTGCTGLKSIELPASLIKLYSFAFSECESLESVTFGDNVTIIEPYAFQLCNSLKEITIPGSVKTIEDHTFQSCKGMKRIIFEEGVETIEADAMLNAYSIERIYLPSTVQSIGDHAFGYSYLDPDYTALDPIIFGYMGTAAESYAQACGFEFEPYNLGDVDNSGYVTAVDAATVLKEYAQTSVNAAPTFDETKTILADVTYDGIITATDASRILACYAYNAAGGDTLPCDYFYDLVNNQ